MPGTGQVHGVLDLVSVVDELLESPGEEVELLTGELFVRVERLENGQPDLR